MQWPFLRRKTENQTAGSVFVIRIIFNNLSIFNRVEDLANRDASQNALVDRMFREFKQSKCEFGTYLFDHQWNYTILLGNVDGAGFEALAAAGRAPCSNALEGEAEDRAAVGEEQFYPRPRAHLRKVDAAKKEPRD